MRIISLIIEVNAFEFNLNYYLFYNLTFHLFHLIVGLYWIGNFYRGEYNYES